MADRFRHFLAFLSRNRTTFALVFFWFAGLLSGCCFAAYSGESFFLLMRTAATVRVSIVGMFAVSFLPFLLSAYAVYCGRPQLMLPLCYCKALMFSWCAFGIQCAFGTAGWLMRLLQFSDLLTVPVFCWFCLRHINRSGTFRRDFITCTALYLLAGSLDYCVVSPFLVMLTD